MTPEERNFRLDICNKLKEKVSLSFESEEGERRVGLDQAQLKLA